MADSQVSLIRRAAPLHDVGKIGIPDSVLLKLGKLTPEEFEIVKTHTTIGARILSGSRFTILRLAEEIAFNHHERWDGNGYAGIAGAAIPLAGRIVAVADVFDALTQKRPYKAAWPVAEAMAEIDRQRGRQFDPALVDAFLRVVEQQRDTQLPVGDTELPRAAE
jgi:putative two-component system response regulator